MRAKSKRNSLREEVRKMAWLLRIVPDVSVALGEVRIPCKNSIKFNGLYLDSKLSETDHCNCMVTKVERNINILRCLSGTWWGAHPYFLKLLYNAIVRSHLDYGSLLLEPIKSTALKRLNLVQAKARRIIVGSMNPINPPLPMHFKLNLQIYLFLFADSFYLSVSYPNHCGFQTTP
ncbi:hypothetical protein EVAR_8621_1 [Eumeta japonica]|uniref:RNA-directed DNA polymerase from mobile element jockey n=1 Tax=Eumeta variegata TaxID=151549 RepID=A0A4C1XH06_EUMVA|nr:hypothetical protein EVAR_8621_1 [Eumeta japonica]